jgi:hypothetical protein
VNTAGCFHAAKWPPRAAWLKCAMLAKRRFEGAALPSIGIFLNPAAVCERYAPGSSRVSWVVNGPTG